MKKFTSISSALLLGAMAFCANAQAPEALYLTGTFNGWSLDADKVVKLTDKGNGVYSGEVTNPTNALEFKFTTDPAEGWGVVYGANEDVKYQLEANTPLTINGWWQGDGGKNFMVDNWAPYGSGTVTIDWNAETVTIESDLVAGEAPEKVLGDRIYLIGAPQGWDINGTSMPLEKVEEGIYEATYNITAGKFQFRFYTQTGNWDINSIGSQVNDNSVSITLTDGIYDGECVEGKGSWQVDNWTGGNVKMTVDFNNMNVVFDTNVEGDVEKEYPDFWVTGNFNGIDWPTPGNEGSVKGVEENGIYTFTVDLGEVEDAVEFKIASAGWTIELGSFDGATVLYEPVKADIVGQYNNFKTTLSGLQTLVLNYDEMVVYFVQESGVESISSRMNEEVIFNLRGMKVDRNNMSKGIYIINGKKVAVK